MVVALLVVHVAPPEVVAVYPVIRLRPLDHGGAQSTTMRPTDAVSDGFSGATGAVVAGGVHESETTLTTGRAAFHAPWTKKEYVRPSGQAKPGQLTSGTPLYGPFWRCRFGSDGVVAAGIPSIAKNGMPFLSTLPYSSERNLQFGVFCR